MIPDFFLSCGTFYNHNPVNKPAKNNKRMLTAAVVHFLDPVEKDRLKHRKMTQNSVSEQVSDAA